MKHTRKIFAVLLALAMVLGLSATAFAAGNTITVNNAVENETYKAYKMLDLSVGAVDEDGNPGAYRYTVNPAWAGFFADTEDAAWKTCFEIDAQGYVSAKTGVENDAAVLKAFAKAAAEYAKDNTLIAVDGTYAEGKVTFNTEDGYYLITSTLGSNAMIDTTPGDVEINEKNEQPEVDKKIKEGEEKVNISDANIGDVVPYEVTISAKPGALNYVLKDTMSKGLTFNNDVAIEDLTAGTDYTVTVGGSGDDFTFKVEFSKAYLDSITENTDIVVTYSATINEEAEVKIAGTNKVQLEYGDDQSTTTESRTDTYVWGFDVYKYTGTIGEDSETPLADAKFSLYADEACTQVIKFTTKAANDYQYAADQDATEGVVTEFTTPADGKFTLEGLAEGTYYLKETAAPEGYNAIADPIKVEISSVTSGDTTTMKLNDVSTDTVNVQNNTGAELPSTGGIGTTIFYVVGAILVLGAGILIVSRKKADKAE